MLFSTRLPGLSRYPPAPKRWDDDLGPAEFRRIVTAADALGYDSITIPEHLVLPNDLVPTMNAKWPHAFTAMAFVAGATEHIQVNSNVIVLPYHHPVNLAKAVTTLDLLSGGRVQLTVGVGHAPEEFAALGVPFNKRGRITDEYLEVLMELWTSDEPTYSGEFVEVHGVAFEPKPVQQPRPPILIGGNSRAAMRRAARYDGWVPWLVQPEELPDRIAELHEQPGFAEKADRFEIAMMLAPPRIHEKDHSPLPGTDGSPDIPDSTEGIIDTVAKLAELGVTRTWVPYPGPAPQSLEDYLEQLQWAAEEVFPHCR